MKEAVTKEVTLCELLFPRKEHEIKLAAFKIEIEIEIEIEVDQYFQ
ncbi:hypothetical protein SAMN05660653_00823 [Desulfonatronum thiosulfatophilum]|uniref:Uncharacterized protein n=1 Tax=Desulfonatronum thiosulfatophilum TaxID=617002 RepID=A0A1G6B9P4_9BACT|nr:hypothetical protein [Desulfonatronum thiosulfatophilum]SDB17341.1 hypothetical protein SAMN05660653_00823 [Desulfonatronum thiosulfatophilum]